MAKKDVAVMLRVTEAERSAFQRCAKKMSLSVSGWMRMTLLAGVRSQKMHMARQDKVLKEIFDENWQRRAY